MNGRRCQPQPIVVRHTRLVRPEPHRNGLIISLPCVRHDGDVGSWAGKGPSVGGTDP